MKGGGRARDKPISRRHGGGALAAEVSQGAEGAAKEEGVRRE